MHGRLLLCKTIQIVAFCANQQSPFMTATSQQTVKHCPSQTREKPSDEEMEKLVYRSGIPTLRSSAHRVKFSPKNRVHDPKPKNRKGKETDTTWLPTDVCQEQIFSYDTDAYDLRGSLARLLSKCNENVVGRFRDGSDRLEDFVIPPQSTWRSVNGGQCEDAQKYLSETVLQDEQFLEHFDRLVREVVLPYLKQRLVRAGATREETGSTTFYYQRPPTLRLQPGPAWSQVKPHDDAIYGHQNGELNFWIPFTDRSLTKVDLHCESKPGKGDYHAIPAQVGEIISFHGSSCKHFVNSNETIFTRVSMDFRVGVEGFFDPYWQMRGTTDDHGRKEIQL